MLEGTLVDVSEVSQITDTAAITQVQRCRSICAAVEGVKGLIGC